MIVLIAAGSVFTSILASGLAHEPGFAAVSVALQVLAALQVLGIVLIAAGRPRIGGHVVLWASLPVMPASLFGVIGAHGVLSECRRERAAA